MIKMLVAALSPLIKDLVAEAIAELRGEVKETRRVVVSQLIDVIANSQAIVVKKSAAIASGTLDISQGAAETAIESARAKAVQHSPVMALALPLFREYLMQKTPLAIQERIDRGVDFYGYLNGLDPEEIAELLDSAMGVISAKLVAKIDGKLDLGDETNE